MQKLNHSCDNQWVKLIDFNIVNKENIVKLNNIGLYKGSCFFVKKSSSSKKLIHIIINQIEYVLRLKDVNQMVVEIIKDANIK